MNEGKKALIIVDMQNDFVIPQAPFCVAGAFKTIPCIKKVLDFFRTDKMPVFHVIRQYRANGSDVELHRLYGFLNGKSFAVEGTEGCKIVSELTPVENEYIIIKNRFSAFMQTELDFILRRLQTTHLVVIGTQYPKCIRATIFDAIAYGYKVTNITDATSAQTDRIAKANIIDLENISVSCLSTDKFLQSARHCK